MKSHRHKGQVTLAAFKMIRALDDRRFGITVDELANEIGRGKRTAYRFIAAAQEAGVPLWKDEDGRWRLA